MKSKVKKYLVCFVGGLGWCEVNATGIVKAMAKAVREMNKKYRREIKQGIFEQFAEGDIVKVEQR
jgi:hypothetical protein